MASTANGQQHAATTALLDLDPRRIAPDPDNVRRNDGDGLDALADSLREHGVLQPLGVTQENGGYRVVYGSRRREAAILAGLPRVPCVLVEAQAEDRLVRQLVENLQRQDLSGLDKAEGLARLRRDVARRPGKSGERELDDAVARTVGLSVSTIRRYLGLRDLSAPVRGLLADGQLTVTQAQHLGAIADPARQEEIAMLAVERGLSAAAIARTCKAALARPNLPVAEAVALGDSEADLPEPVKEKAKVERVARAPKAESDDDADLWADSGDVDDDDDGPVARVAETADGHRVFRIRTVAAFCDEVDRLARALVDGDLAKAADDDPAAPIKLRLASRQLEHTGKLLTQLLAKRGWK